MPQEPTTFADKFLRRLKKVDTEQIENFLQNVLREKAFLEVVFDSLTEGVVVTERSGNVVFINESARQLLGLLRRDCIGKSFHSLIKARAILRLADEYAELLEPIKQREVLVRTPAVRTYAITILPIENESSLTTHTVWVISDRTESKRRMEEQRQIDNIESLATLTAGVAHEVKNPLNSLNIHAQLSRKSLANLAPRLEGEPALERLEKSNSVILEEIERLTHIVDDFIKAVRPVRPQIRKFELNKILIDVAELIGPECQAREIDLTLDLDPEIQRVQLDPDQIQQCVLNIAKNALEAVEDLVGRIKLRTILRSDHVLIEVEDNGCGINEEDRLRIFEPYHTTKETGTGLGLMVVYRIVRAHRGALGLRGDVGKGTVFSIALPLDERPVRMLEAQIDPPIADLSSSG